MSGGPVAFALRCLASETQIVEKTGPVLAGPLPTYYIGALSLSLVEGRSLRLVRRSGEVGYPEWMDDRG